LHTETVGRDPSIDVFRGALVVLLVIVEYLPPSPDYPWLRHSPWNGVRVADFVFPAFLFVVGASMAAGRPQRWTRIARRTVLLLALGLVFNAATEMSPLRLTGVLQTIAVSGALSWVVITLMRRPEPVAWVAFALLLVHGALLPHSFAIDRAVFGREHLYLQGMLHHDPEGILNTIFGATAVVLFGWVATRVRSSLFAGALLAVGLVACIAWEPNKRAWTPSFALLISGACAAILLARIDVPVLGAIGRNALLVYFGQHIVHELVLNQATGGTPHAQLAYAGIGTVAWSTAAVVLGRLGVRLRV
jgi:predicted acyltransferase